MKFLDKIWPSSSSTYLCVKRPQGGMQSMRGDPGHGPQKCENFILHLCYFMHVWGILFFFILHSLKLKCLGYILFRWSSTIIVTERWARSSSRCKGSQLAGDFLSHPRQWADITLRKTCVTFPAKERHRPLTGSPVPSHTAWWQRHIGVNNFPKVVTQRCPRGN